ncbi:MAG TPA: NAD(P)H-dependent glycerol-3-phosphate dehydrogenase [Polyangiaceae bacterium]|nr:NAD(P)H-dependent glycerol-3-phosphate dehydrogenase [Polyangiaceae bacterium]
MRVAVVGAGAWGTALARTFAQAGVETLLWTWQAEHAQALGQERENRQFFPGYPLPPNLRVTSDVAEAAGFADALLLVVPSTALRETLVRFAPHLRPDVVPMTATKGIEAGSCLLMSQVIESVLGAPAGARTVALSGPSFAREVAERMPTNLVAACHDIELGRRIQALLSNDFVRVYTSEDVIGVEVGGALKNVIAVAAGASDGLGLGHNTRAALITRGIAEMSRLAVALGGQSRTLAGLSGIGDLVLTCTGDLSRNRTLGQRLASGLSLEEALGRSAGVAEGYWTARSVHDLARRHGVDLPICAAVHSVLHEGISLQEALRVLLTRPLHAEWE